MKEMLMEAFKVTYMMLVYDPGFSSIKKGCQHNGTEDSCLFFMGVLISPDSFTKAWSFVCLCQLVVYLFIQPHHRKYDVTLVVEVLD